MSTNTPDPGPAIPDDERSAVDPNTLLSDEERAALADDDDEGDDGEGGTPEAGKPDAEAPKKVAAEEPARRPAEEPAPRDVVEEDVRRAPQPLLKVDVPADIADKLAANKAERAALRKQFDEGDIASSEFFEKMDALDDARRAIDSVVLQAEISQKLTAGQAEEAWFQRCDRFLAEHPEIGATNLRYETFDHVLRQVTGSAEHANLSPDAKLDLALRTWRTELGLPETPATPSAQPGTPRRVTVPTLGKLPAAAGDGIGNDGKFSVLDNLIDKDPIAYETALSRMSDHDRAEYLARS